MIRNTSPYGSVIILTTFPAQPLKAPDTCMKSVDVDCQGFRIPSVMAGCQDLGCRVV